MSAIEMVVFQFEYKWSIFGMPFETGHFLSGFQMIPEFERPVYGSSMYHYLITRYIHKFDWAKLKVIWHAALRLAFVKSGWKFIDRVKIGF